MTLADQLLRDLMEDAVYRGDGGIATDWIRVANHRWAGEDVADLWEQFREAVIARDRLCDKPGLPFAEYDEFFDADDLAMPRQDVAIEIKATEADETFMRLLRGPTFPPLRTAA